ncbi:hypothetical protein [Candidatus Nitronereus thalassa]|uniref:PRC-barrel domain protein n=1 Tax=Candidatus Nitronereus thalassa TaxID=3020898 RepID=A0ABU3KBK7_9BACT|nr:hypothetical protein [Candidatus Nitronereus thalassa]MDT7043703.1 hypothetical protein [Candidatus Nitronereus thalassa]
MLRNINAMIGHSLEASDGNIGCSSDFLFDDRDWVIRYMVADTQKWLPGRKVLIASSALMEPDWDQKCFPVELTKQQIKDSPPLDEHAPVSREYEILFHKYYGYPNYWEMPLFGGSYPGMSLGPSLQEPHWSEDMAADYQHAKENSLRSVLEVIGYGIQAQDSQVGEVKDFIIDDLSWTIRWLVVDTRKFLPGPKALVAPVRVDSIAWAENDVQVNLSVDQIKTCPEFDPTIPITQEYENRLAEHYAQPRN